MVEIFDFFLCPVALAIEVISKDVGIYAMLFEVIGYHFVILGIGHERFLVGVNDQHAFRGGGASQEAGEREQ